MAANLTDTIRITVAQLNSVVGDIDGNLKKAREARAKAAAAGADLLVLSELFIAGYPPEDLVLKPAFPDACRAAVEALAADTADGGPGIVIGTPWPEGGKVYNAVALLDGGAVQALRYKVELPNYGVFDEFRVFEVGPLPGPVGFRGLRLGLPICEDIWFEQVCECLLETGAEMLIVPNGSPYWQGKADVRQQVAHRPGGRDRPAAWSTSTSAAARTNWSSTGAPSAFMATGRWRSSCRSSPKPSRPSPGSGTASSAGVAPTDVSPVCPLSRMPTGRPVSWACATMSTRPVSPASSSGLSGGINSAVCATMAVDALGADRVHCVMLPYRYTSNESLNDAAALAERLGVRYDIVPIADPVEGFDAALKPLFGDSPPDTTEENLQSRARGTILMAVSNKFGSMVLTTGNKSENSVGYATLYGDMNGGFNPIKDLYKTEVYKLARWRNANRPANALGPGDAVIPENIITRAPSAELRPDQTDQDSLPPYDVLDEILECLVEDEMRISEIVARGHDLETVRRVERLLYIAEYKRRQAAPGVKITRKNFGRDRRYPIVNKFRDRS